VGGRGSAGGTAPGPGARLTRVLTQTSGLRVAALELGQPEVVPGRIEDPEVDQPPGPPPRATDRLPSPARPVRRTPRGRSRCRRVAVGTPARCGPRGALHRYAPALSPGRRTATWSSAHRVPGGTGARAYRSRRRGRGPWERSRSAGPPAAGSRSRPGRCLIASSVHLSPRRCRWRESNLHASPHLCSGRAPAGSASRTLLHALTLSRPG